MEFSCEQIGLNQEELQERIVDGLAEKLLYKYVVDEEGDFQADSPIKKRLDKLIQETIDGEVERLGQKFIIPKIQALIEGAAIQATNQWGETKGEPKTFIEYLVDRADAYMREPVDYNGKSKSELSSYDSNRFKRSSTRLTWQVDNKLQYAIDAAMKTIIKGANESLADSLSKTVRFRIKEIADSVKVETKIK